MPVAVAVPVIVTVAPVVTAAIVTVWVIAVGGIVAIIWVAPTPAPEGEATNEDDIIKVIMVVMMMMPIATPIAAIPVLAIPVLTTPFAHSVGNERSPASRGHRHEMVTAMWCGRRHRRSQHNRNKATKEKYRFCLHRCLGSRKLDTANPKNVAVKGDAVVTSGNENDARRLSPSLSGSGKVARNFSARDRSGKNDITKERNTGNEQLLALLVR